MVESTATYPSNDAYHVVSVVELRNGLLARQVEYFGPVFPAPEWRKDWVEPIES